MASSQAPEKKDKEKISDRSLSDVFNWQPRTSQIRQICDYAAKHKDNIAQDLKDIPGIGAAAKRKLVANGITNVIQLETSMEELLKKSGDIVCAIEEFLQWLTNNGLRASVWTKVAALAIGHKVQKMNPESVTKNLSAIDMFLSLRTEEKCKDTGELTTDTEIGTVMKNAGLQEDQETKLKKLANCRDDLTIENVTEELIRNHVSSKAAQNQLLGTNEEILLILKDILTKDRLDILQKICQVDQEDPFLDILEIACRHVYQPPWDTSRIESPEFIENLRQTDQGFLQLRPISVYDLDRISHWTTHEEDQDGSDGDDDDEDEDDSWRRKTLQHLEKFANRRLYHAAIGSDAVFLMQEEFYDDFQSRPRTDFGNGLYLFNDYDVAVRHAIRRGNQALQESEASSIDVCIVVWPWESERMQYVSQPKLGTNALWKFYDSNLNSQLLRVWTLIREPCNWVELVTSYRQTGSVDNCQKRCCNFENHDGCTCQRMPCEKDGTDNRCSDCTELDRCFCVRRVGCHGTCQGGTPSLQRRRIRGAIRDGNIDIVQGFLSNGRAKYHRERDSSGNRVLQLAVKSRKGFDYFERTRKQVIVWKLDRFAD